jgi:hypothetical protein
MSPSIQGTIASRLLELNSTDNDNIVDFIAQSEYDNTDGQFHLRQLDDRLELRSVIVSDLNLLYSIFHVASRASDLHLAYHITHIPAPDVAPRSHSASSPHIAARSHISSNLHLALSSLISCCILRIISLILHLLCIYFVRRSYFAAQSAHFPDIIIAQKNILGPGLYLIRTRVF